MLVLAAGLAGLMVGTARAQPGQPAPAAGTPAAADTSAGGAVPPQTSAAPSSSDALSPLRLMDGPSLHETGRIAVAPAPMPTGVIENDALPSASKEKSIARAASSIDRAPAPRPAGFIDPQVLDREIAGHFADIAGCRIEVARVKQLKPAEIVADKLLLRWIIAPDGTTASTDVVAIQPVDLGIMDCAKRVMSQWTFTRPRGGPMTVERRFTFN
ncbi:MAG TPA: hypothetical protein VKQ32_27880 [Polyangia bacterium]|nr:hypothetical protein [Polyangia bacterium]